MKLDILNPAKKLKASYQRLHIDRDKIELFKENIKRAFQDIAIANKKKESEEHYKAIVRDFLLDTYYKGSHSINTQGRNDLVIHNGANAESPVGIIIETKQPTNKSEMISPKNPNSKSFQQLISYFLKERFENKNIEIKHLIISNIYEWYIFDASDFERYFYDNKKIKDSYLSWNNGSSLMSKTDWFYKEVLFPHIEENLDSIPCTYFNLKDYETIINNDNVEDDETLLDLYKILSPEHLLKKQVANDSNSLNKQFYSELLHILGLEEVKEGSKKTIKRCAKPNEGSILENTISKLNTKARELSETEIYDTALELTITWLNRILFLKLLEGQLIKYNNNPDFAFLNYKKIDEYDILEELFFEVLAVNYKDRPASIQKLYANIPYLNSSLFEETELERKYFGIGLLKDRLDIPIFSNTVLNFQVKGSSKKTLEYLFEFLDAYDFGDESKGKIKEHSKSIINASVLGLIFEKINGYKDGSFFTPSFITMYMCRESIRRAVVQKFNESYGWKCEEFVDLKNEIKSIKKKEANKVINQLRICDPAVGSGHFLVSALNEMISIKQDLKILIDQSGEDFSEYNIDIENDELIIKDEKGNPYSYKVSNKESRRFQETLFNEKQTIIENCLFGVDINPKSVMICRLRLWIELLKNAYYTESSKFKELETLPNIDINIKCGNSLISKFEVKDSVFESIPNFQTRLKEYTTWVQLYKGEKDKSAKAQFAKKIDQFKSEFKLKDKRTDKVQNEIDKVTMEILKSKNPMFPLTDAEKAKVKEYETKLEKLTQEKKDIEDNPIYNNAFEWRFEFPEVLNDKGEFVGFDVVIGNPPWGAEMPLDIKNVLKSTFSNIDSSTPNTFAYFIGLSYKITSNYVSQILPDSILVKDYSKTRELISKNLYETRWYQNTAIPEELRPFIDVEHDVCIINMDLKNTFNNCKVGKRYYKQGIVEDIESNISKEAFILNKYDYLFNLQISKNDLGIISKTKNLQVLNNIVQCHEGIHTGNIREKLFVKSNTNNEKPLFIGAKNGDKINRYVSQRDGWFVNYNKDIINKEKEEYASLRDINIFINPKIYITRTGNPFKAFLDEATFASNNFFSIQFKNYETNTLDNLKPILALLNCKFSNYFIRTIIAPSLGNTFIETKIFHILEIPIPSDLISNKKLIKLVNQIISIKQSNPDADTSALETEIDELVYALYGLTEEEIKVVEGKN